jgi:hypothetical protein
MNLLNPSAPHADPIHRRGLHMTPNVGNTDRIVRIVFGVLIIGWGLYAQNWLGAIGLIPLVTGLIRWCPLYAPLKISTNKS